MEGRELKPHVFAVDLHAASAMAGVSYEDLINGISSQDAMRMQELLMESESESESDSDNKDEEKLDVMVLTSTKRTSLGIPYSLQQLGGKSVLEHSLSQLLLAGFDRVVVAVPGNNSDIRKHIENSVFFRRMNIVFLELQQDVLDSIPEVVLSARHLFTGHFLLHAADRVFDKNLLLRFDAFHRGNNSVCMLLESNKTVASRMHPSTARIQYSPDQKHTLAVTRGNHISENHGIDAGLYVVSEKVFVVLDNLIHGVGTICLAEALAFGFHSVKCMQINDSPWLCVNSEALLLQATEKANCLSAFTPFTYTEDVDDSTAIITSSNRAAPPPPPSKRRKSVLLSVPATASSSLIDHPQMRKTKSTRRSKSLVATSSEMKTFEGFIVPLKEPTVVPSTNVPLISIKDIRDHRLPSHVTLSKSQPQEYTLAMPLDTATTTKKSSRNMVGHVSPATHAFLIQQENNMSSSQQHDFNTKSADLQLRRRSTFLLAVPKEKFDAAAEEKATAIAAFEPIVLLRRVSKLPSDVTNVTLEASAAYGAIAMQLTVTKKVPWVGYVLLLVALLSVSSQGAAMQVLVGVHPFLKLFWRMSGSAILFGLLALLTTTTTQRPLSLFSFSWKWVVVSATSLQEGLSCTLAYVIFNTTFIWALDHTSVGHAYIFSNCHSLLLVLGKTTFLGQIVRPVEALGALLGMVGAAVTTMDHGQAAAIHYSMTPNATKMPNHDDLAIMQQMTTPIRVIEPSTIGDLVALAGAIGGVFYLTYAKILRDRMGVFAFLAFLFLTTSITLLPLMTLLQVPYTTFSFDPNIGLLGWVSHLGVEVIIVGVCSGMGTMGFVSAMKYFPPIVISVTMLLEPVIATVISVASGTASFPGLCTYIGGFAVIFGTCMVISSSSSSETTVDVTESIKSCHGSHTPPKMKGYGSI